MATISRLDQLMFEKNDLLEALLVLDSERKQEELEENPDALTWCCKCGQRVRLADIDQYGNCC